MSNLTLSKLALFTVYAFAGGMNHCFVVKAQAKAYIVNNANLDRDKFDSFTKFIVVQPSVVIYE